MRTSPLRPMLHMAKDRKAKPALTTETVFPTRSQRRQACPCSSRERILPERTSTQHSEIAAVDARTQAASVTPLLLTWKTNERKPHHHASRWQPKNCPPRLPPPGRRPIH